MISEEAQQQKLADTLEALRQYAKSLSRFPTREEWNDQAAKQAYRWYGADALNRKIGWNKLARQFGYSVAKSFSANECEKWLTVAGREQPAISKKEYDEWRRTRPEEIPTAQQITRRLGGWNEAKRRCGLITIEADVNTLVFSAQDCVDALRQCASDLGGRQRFDEREYAAWRETRTEPTPHIETIRVKLGGSLPSAKRGIDLDTWIPGDRRQSGKQVESTLYAWLSEILSERAYEEWRQTHNEAPGVKSLTDRFGDWDRVLKTAWDIWRQAGGQPKKRSGY